jgi:tetratricopeptide (TPR) repeat protein
MKKNIARQIALISLIAAMASKGVFANTISSDAEFTALARARKTAELEALARDRLAKNNKDDIALWYLGRFVAGDAKKRDELIPRAEQCIKDLPQSARCHNLLGTLYGAAALSAGLTAGIKYASRIKEMFVKAIELDPKQFDMRRDLNQFYLQAPGIAAGSVRKAVQNSADFATIDPARGQLLRADVHVYEKEFDKAESLVNNIKVGNDAELAESVRTATANIGYALINADAAPKAEKLFTKQIAADPGYATAHFGLGRALLEQKQIDAAIASMERALQLDAKLTAHYRLGLAYQAKGDKPKAAAMFKQFLTYSTQGKATDDARKRLDEMKVG